MIDQPRDTIGRFADKPQSAPEITLNGSFLYPPGSYRGVDEFIEFWSTVPIPEEALLNFTSAYKANRDVWFDGEMHDFKMQLDSTPEAFTFTKRNGLEAWVRHRMPQVEAKAAQLDSIRPPFIPPERARELARVFQMGHLRERHGFSAEEKRRIGAVVMYTTAGLHTMQRLWDTYRFEELPQYALTDRNFADSVLRREQR